MTTEYVDPNSKIGKIQMLHKKGYGFITSKDIPFTKIFFHWTYLHSTTLKFPELEEGMEVEFTPREIDKGGEPQIHAFNIHVLESETKEEKRIRREKKS